MNNIDFTKLKPVEYARKSSESEDKQMLSITSQHDANKKSAEFYNLPPFIEVFQEAKSAKTEHLRTEFSRMMSDIDKGLIDCIVCWKADRLARNMTEGGRIIDALSSGKIKAIVTHDKVFYPWDNVIVLSVEFSQGKQFVKELSINVKRGQTKKASMGLPHGVASLGFINDSRGEKGNKKWIVDEVRLGLISTILNRFLTGTYSAGSLHKYAVGELKLTTVKRKRTGGAFIQRSRIYEILKDPVYAGFFFYNKKRYELDPSLPRLITEAEHEKIKMLLTKANIPKAQHHKTTYSGFITSQDGNFIGQDVKFQVICDCKHKFAYRNKTNCPNCGIGIDSMSNPKYLSYVWHYNVSAKKNSRPYKSIAPKEIDAYMINFALENLQFSSELVEWSKNYIHELKDKEVAQKVTINKNREVRKVEFEEKKAKLRSMYCEGKFSDEEYSSDLERLNRTYSDVNSIQTDSVDWYSRMMEITDITSSIADVFASDNVEAKRTILTKLGSNLVWNDKELKLYNDVAIEKLIEGINRAKALNTEFEPRDCVVYKGLNEKTEVFSSVFSTLLCGQDSNLRPSR